MVNRWLIIPAVMASSGFSRDDASSLKWTPGPMERYSKVSRMAAEYVLSAYCAGYRFGLQGNLARQLSSCKLSVPVVGWIPQSIPSAAQTILVINKRTEARACSNRIIKRTDLRQPLPETVYRCSAYQLGTATTFSLFHLYGPIVLEDGGRQPVVRGEFLA